jgi:hypothetical protein
MTELPNRSSGDSTPTVQITPPDIVRRRLTAWRGVRAEVIKVIWRDRFEHKFHARRHLLITSERASADDDRAEIESNTHVSRPYSDIVKGMTHGCFKQALRCISLIGTSVFA